MDKFLTMLPAYCFLFPVGPLLTGTVYPPFHLSSLLAVTNAANAFAVN